MQENNAPYQDLSPIHRHDYMICKFYGPSATQGLRRLSLLSYGRPALLVRSLPSGSLSFSLHYR